jgi:hypothetical protein
MIAVTALALAFVLGVLVTEGTESWLPSEAAEA